MTGILGALKAIFSAFGAAFAFFKDRQLINAGKATERADNVQKTLDTVERVTSPLSDPELQRVREKWRRD